MLSYAEHPLRKAMAKARDACMDRADMISMVSDVFNPPPEAEAALAADVVYDELPEGLIDLPTACREYGVNTQTANGWWRKYVIPHMGKLRAPARGGGFNVTRESDFADKAGKPLDKGGRPMKTA